MVDYKSKYLEMKLKYINAKNKIKGGTMSNQPLLPDVKRVRPKESQDSPIDTTVSVYQNQTERTQLIHPDVSLFSPETRKKFAELTRTVSDGPTDQIGLYHDIIMQKYDVDPDPNKWDNWNHCKGPKYDVAMLEVKNDLTSTRELYKPTGEKTYLIKWEQRGSAFPTWVRNNKNKELAFNPFAAGFSDQQKIDQERCYQEVVSAAGSAKNIDRACVRPFWFHTMFFAFYDEHNEVLTHEFKKYKDEIERLNDIEPGKFKITIDDLRYLKNMMLGYNNCEPQECVIMECNTSDLVRVCDNFQLEGDCEGGSDKWEDNSGWLNEIRDKNSASPMTGKGYTYAIDRLGDDDIYGMSEVLLPTSKNIMVKPIAVIPERVYLTKILEEA